MRDDMARKIDPKKLLKKNRSVDAKQLAEVSDILKSLRRHGIKSAGYNILAPFTRRQTNKVEQSEEDPRTIHFRS